MSLLWELQRRNVIRVAIAYVAAAWAIVQVIDVVFPAFGYSSDAVRTAVVILTIGFIPAVVLSWLFEWTPDGLRRDGDVAEPSPGKTNRTRKFDRAIILVLTLGIAVLAYERFVLVPSVDRVIAEEAQSGYYGGRSIAVLPFDALNSDPDKVAFVDGITEEVINLLTAVPELRVIQRSSAFAADIEEKDDRELAESLDVGFLLRGSVRQAGDHVRVSARLIHGSTSAIVWNGTYDRDLEDVFEIQDEIAAHVVDRLKIQMLYPLPQSRTVNPLARSLTIRAWELYEVRSGGRADGMYELAKKALEHDPDYVPALTALAMGEFFRWADGDISLDDLNEIYFRLEKRVAALDPKEGFFAFGSAWELARQGRLEEAAAAYIEALEEKFASSEELRWAGDFAQLIGKPDPAIRLIKHAIAIDPYCYQCRRALSRYLLIRGKEGDVERARRIREEYFEDAFGGLPDYSTMLLLAGDPQAVIDLWTGLDGPIGSQKSGFLAMAEFELGKSDEARSRLSQIEKGLQDAIENQDAKEEILKHRYALAAASAWVGDADTAFEQLMIVANGPQGETRTWAQREVFHPQWHRIRGDARWPEYRAALDMSNERLEAIEFDPPLPE